jgi:hypothetical protein
MISTKDEVASEKVEIETDNIGMISTKDEATPEEVETGPEGVSRVCQ